VALTAKKKLDPDRIVVATQDFGTTQRTVKRGERFRASDPLVGDGRWFVDADVPESEWPNLWNEMPAPPEHRGPVAVPPSIPPHRQVRSKLDVFQPAQWAPGSDGSMRGVPPPFGSALRRGQILDVGDSRVAENPGGFEWIVRDVTPEDLDRLREAKGNG
jgi:hypothetical protein